MTEKKITKPCTEATVWRDVDQNGVVYYAIFYGEPEAMGACAEFSETAQEALEYCTRRGICTIHWRVRQ